MRFENYEEAPPFFSFAGACLVSSTNRVLWRQERERNMILAATVNRYQLDQVEQATKIQFPDDEIRNHDDRSGKHHNNILEGAVNEERRSLVRE